MTSSQGANPLPSPGAGPSLPPPPPPSSQRPLQQHTFTVGAQGQQTAARTDATAMRRLSSTQTDPTSSRPLGSRVQQISSDDEGDFEDMDALGKTPSFLKASDAYLSRLGKLRSTRNPNPYDLSS